MVHHPLPSSSRNTKHHHHLHVLWTHMHTLLPSPALVGALQQSQHPLWSCVPSWHDTDGEGYTPLVPLCLGAVSLILKPVGTGRNTQASPGVVSYHICRISKHTVRQGRQLGRGKLRYDAAEQTSVLHCKSKNAWDMERFLFFKLPCVIFSVLIIWYTFLSLPHPPSFSTTLPFLPSTQLDSLSPQQLISY